MQLWPAIDLLDGAAVRLQQGRFDRVTVYDPNPSAIAARWRGRSPRLHVVDLAGARGGMPAQTEAILAILEAFGSGLQVGGGIRDRETAARYLSAGVERVVLGTAAIKNPELVRDLSQAYPHRVVLAVDARDGFVATDGWEQGSTTQAVDLVRSFADCPLAAILYTDIERDGMGGGPNIARTVQLAEQTGVPVLASGGVGSLEDLRTLAGTVGIVGVIVGRALYEESFTLEDARVAAGDVP